MMDYKLKIIYLYDIFTPRPFLIDFYNALIKKAIDDELLQGAQRFKILLKNGTLIEFEERDLNHACFKCNDKSMHSLAVKNGLFYCSRCLSGIVVCKRCKGEGFYYDRGTAVYCDYCNPFNEIFQRHNKELPDKNFKPCPDCGVKPHITIEEGVFYLHHECMERPIIRRFPANKNRLYFPDFELAGYFAINASGYELEEIAKYWNGREKKQENNQCQD